MSSAPLAIPNPTRDRMAAGDVALGMNVRLGHNGDIARIAKATGHDFIFIDMQHSLFATETVGHIAQAALGCGISPMVRVRTPEDPNVPLLLDNGVTGIIFPDVETAEDARRAVNAAKFAPVGTRSVCGGYPYFNYAPTPLTQTIPAMNAATLVVCMIETMKGLQNVEEIAAVDGVDVVHVGANDLLTSMGKPGQFGDPEIMAAIERVIDVAKAHGRYSGFGGDRNVERQVSLIRRGARFVTTQTDIGFLMAEANRVTGSLRTALAAKAA
ncbi:aldolase/citrate lyase family protein [Aquabacter sp. CN5-332]|uniref:HpcH/HpaI aldolase family protein n=1 Tax=Aquabacter sp. CN5-332 TaxID=3156608 RepID=UPI0032B45DA0